MLTLDNRFINVSMSLPKTSYVKMVDVWLLFTLLIPFLEVSALNTSVIKPARQARGPKGPVR